MYRFLIGYDSMIADNSFANRLLQAVGRLLAADGAAVSIVVAGGTAMNLNGFVDRPTRDVDILARAQGSLAALIPPEPLPESLQRAITVVARDFDQPPDWMNTAMAMQWLTGIPPGLEHRLTWRRYDSLEVGIVGRTDLIAFKLYAAADQVGPDSVHMGDLLALRPDAGELRAAADWIRTQDTSPAFHELVERVIAYAQQHAG